MDKVILTTPSSKKGRICNLQWLQFLLYRLDPTLLVVNPSAFLKLFATLTSE